MKADKTLQAMYRALRAAFGHQGWWPGRSRFEVIVGAILTQNTNWRNVEKAIANLRAAGVLSPGAIRDLPQAELARLIRPAGYFNVKARRLAAFVRWLEEECGGNLDRMFARPLAPLREALLSVRGIGPETADSILLYAGQKPSFVVDAYTWRVLTRHGLVPEETSYDEMKAVFEENLPADTPLFNDFHAQIVRVGKEFCRKTEPRCEAGCPLAPFLDR